MGGETLTGTYGHLADAWVSTAAAAGARGDIAGVGVQLLGAYADRSRGYHDLQHLDEVLRHIDKLAPEAEDVQLVRLGAWFHDAVYDGAPDAERRSADLAESQLRLLKLDEGRVAEVTRLVLLTAGHDPADGDCNGAVLCDADLAILAADPERYAAYAAGVRSEYSGYDDIRFAAGRTAVLRGLLERPALYRTPYGREHWERPARHNVSKELALLGLAAGYDGT